MSVTEPLDPPRRRALRRRLAVVAIGLALPVVLVELGLRLFDPMVTAEAIERERFSSDVLIATPDGDFALRPGARGSLFGTEAVIGAHGFRSPPVATPRPDDVYRVLIVGDSVAFGWGVAEADAFPRVMERELNAAPLRSGKRRVEVIAAAVPGWGMPHYLRFVEAQGRAWQPDVVIVTLINNDLTDLIDAQDQRPREKPFLLPAWLRWTYLSRVVEQTVARFGDRAVRSDFFVAIELDPERRRIAGALICQGFTRMKELLGEVPLCVMDTIVGHDGERLDDVVACAAQGGFTRIDASLARPDYKAVYAVGRTDDHPNAAGHKELARIAVEWLRAR
ncbi:MAG: SGNH/GDSL hydrolase family protein [Planctomycetes bacterium]|nr:SGNH/GDSL hydrolase family protein [Planctomycetota bacterium]